MAILTSKNFKTSSRKNLKAVFFFQCASFASMFSNSTTLSLPLHDSSSALCLARSCRHIDMRLALGEGLERAKSADDNCSFFLSYETLTVEEACLTPALFSRYHGCLHHSGEQIYINIKSRAMLSGSHQTC